MLLENEFIIKLLADLDKAKSVKQVNSGIKNLEKTVNMLRLTATLSKGESKKILNQYVKQLESQLNQIKLSAKLDRKNLKADIDQMLNKLTFKDIDLNVSEDKTKLKIKKVIADAKKTVQSNSLTMDIELKKSKLDNQLTTYLSKNTKIRESSVLLDEVEKVRTLISNINDRKSWRNAADNLQVYKSSVAAAGYQTKSTTDKIKGLLGGVTKIGSVLSVASMAVNNFSKSFNTLKEIDSILIEISKTSDSTQQQLAELGSSSFQVANKYGQLATSYLTAVQEMNRSGFYGEQGEELGKLTLKTQAAGDVTAETARNYLLATSAAYGYKGSVEKLTAVLDGQNNITNRNSVDMETMATATEKAGSVASNAGIRIDQLSAMVGTISARTKEAGGETGTGLKSLIINLQNIASDKIVSTLKKANASMTEMKNGIEQLRNPIEILKDLAKTYNSLDESDPLKSQITTNIGQKYHANQLAALLSGWADYEKMLQDYSEGMGSAETEALKTANSLQGRLNQLQNSWDSLVNTIVNKDALKGGVSFLDGLIQGAEKLIDTVGEIPVAMTAIQTSLTALNKDYGISQIFNKDTKKLDIQGNLFGIDITAIKQQKAHFAEASTAIEKWNSYLSVGKTDINKFGEEVVKNNAQLKAYLQTCSTEAPASLAGYQSYLNAAGIATDALRLKTVLLNSVVGFGIGMAIQAAVSGVAYLVEACKNEAEAVGNAKEALEESVSEYDSVSDEIESLNGELETCRERLNELQKLADNGTISVADEKELETLKQTNDELKRKLALKKADQIEEQEKVLEDNEDLLNKTVDSKYKTMRFTSGASQVETASTVTVPEELGYALDKFDALNYMLEQGSINQKEFDNEIKSVKSDITEYSEVINTSVDAYDKLIAAGVTLHGKDLIQYNMLKDLQDRYLLYNYTLYGTAEAYRALSDEQKKDIIFDKLEQRGLSKQDVEEVYKQMSSEQKDSFYEVQFDFKAPDKNQYKTAAAYGKAYVDVMFASAREEASQKSKVESPLSFSKAWSGLEDEAQEKLLELAKAGELTPDVLSSNEKYADILKSVGDSAEIAAQKINKMVDTSDQLTAMKSGISSISSVLAEKKDNLSHKKTKEVGIGADTLAGFDAEIKGLDSWDDFEETLGNGKSSMEACQKAANKLATEWVNSNNFLSQLNKTNKNYYISTLKEMGVKNAEAVVTSTLNNKIEAQNNLEDAAKEAKISLASATWENISATDTYKNATEEAKSAMQKLYVQENILSNNDLGLQSKVNELQKYAKSALGVAVASQIAAKAMHNVAKSQKAGWSTLDYQKSFNTNYVKEFNKVFNQVDLGVDVNPSPATSGSGSKSTKDKKSKTKESKQEINWISRKLEVLQSKIDLTKAKFENLFSVDSKKNNLNTQISQTTKLLNAQQKAATNYQKKANSVKLSSSLKNKVKNGKITGNLSSLIATYGESTANKITKYQDYIDKAKEATKAVQELKKNLLELKEEKYQLYVDQADAKISALDAQEANATTASSKNKYEQSKLSWIKQSYNYQIKIAQLEKDSTKVAQLRAEKEKEIADSYKVQFDNIKNEYENKVALNESDIATTQAKISALEAQGRRLSTAYYSSMIATTAKDRALLAEEKAKLETSLKNIKTGSDEWYEAKQDIASVAQEIYECDQNMAEFQKTINELELKPFELIASQLESASNHTQFLIDLLSHKDLTSKDVGGVTKEGMATLSLYFDRMKQNQDMIQNTQNEWNKFTEQLAQGNSGLSEEEIQGTYEEYAQTIRDAIEANEDFKDSVKSLVEEAFNVQLDALNDLIEKRKEALQSEKDLYDYQRKIADQTKQITSIQKQMTALTGDDSEETRARLQELKVSLDEAEQDLKDTEYDKYISDQEDMLDDLSTDFEDFITNALNDTDNLIACVEKAINENSGMIADIIKEQGYGDANAVGTKYNSDGSYETTVTNYDGGQTKYSYDGAGNLKNIVSTDKNGNIIYNKAETDAKKAEEEKAKQVATAKAQSDKETRQTLNNTYLQKIINTLAKSRPPKSQNEYQTANITKYGSQMFADKYGNGKLLAATDAKHIDDYVKQLKNVDTGKAMYTTATADNVLTALTSINKKYGKALVEAVKNNKTSGITGFANGGVVGGNSYTGDKLYAKVNSGESILTKKFTDTLPTAVDVMNQFNNSYQSPNTTKYVKNTPVTQTIKLGKIEFHLDGSDIKDFATFERAFYDAYKNSNKMQTAIQDSITSTIMKEQNNSIYGR